MLKFTPISFDREEEYNRLYNQCAEKSSDFSFINMWSWNDKYHFEWAFANGLCWLRYQQNGQLVYAPPVGNWKRGDWCEILHKNFPNGFEMHKVPEALAKELQSSCPAQVNLQDDRNNWEYIYSVNELVSLNGYRFRNKRKLSNKFKQYYNFIFKKLETGQIPEVIKFQKEWMKQPEIQDYPQEELALENKAILKVLENWAHLSPPLFGGVLWVDNKIVAYTIGEVADDKNLIIHFEKALFNYKGAYQAINRITLEQMGSYKLVNREQDLGHQGLRQAKLDYNPVHYIKKYNLTYTSTMQ